MEKIDLHKFVEHDYSEIQRYEIKQKRLSEAFKRPAYYGTKAEVKRS